MNIRTQGEPVSGSSALRTAETALSAKVEGRIKTGISGGASDSIDISSLASQIADANRIADVRENSRIEALASLYSKGEGNVDSLNVSRSLIEHSLRVGIEDEL